MPNLQNTLARLGSLRLSELLGAQTTSLLEVLDLRQLSPSRLAGLVLRQFGPEKLLLDRRYREELFGALAREDAERLCNLLGLEASDPWAALSRLNFLKSQTRTDVLFAFFGAVTPSPAEGADERLAQQLLESRYPLFPHQRQAYRETVAYLSSRIPRVLLHMPTGAGKTRTAMNVICEQLRQIQNEKTVVVWLAHSEELCDQAAEEFANAWTILGDRSLRLYRHYGSFRVDLEQVHDGLLISSLQSLYSRSLSRQSEFLDLGRRTRLVVMDEAHQAIAPTYNHLLRLLAPSEGTSLLGLSATPGRSWLDAREDLELARFFNSQKVTLSDGGLGSPILFLQREGFLARVESISLPYAPGRELVISPAEVQALREGFDLPDRIIAALASEHARNLLVINTIMAEASTGASIIVFACSVEHAKLLANILEIKGYTAAAITAETDPERRRRQISQFRQRDGLQILTNFGVLTTGFDAPGANVAVIARPTRSVVLYNQMVGRVMRGPRVGGNETCKVFTVADQLLGFRSAAEAFGFWEDIWE